VFVSVGIALLSLMPVVPAGVDQYNEFWLSPQPRNDSMGILQHGLAAAVACLAIAAGPIPLSGQQPGNDQSRRPKVTLRATPSVGVAPARIVITAELVGGANDFEEYYCPTVEWDWGDDTRSESTSDCDPYEVGKSEIRRRFTVEHVFRRAGEYKLFLRLKQRDKVVATGTTNLTIRPGVSG
jgi:hypothetical protein